MENTGRAGHYVDSSVIVKGKIVLIQLQQRIKPEKFIIHHLIIS